MPFSCGASLIVKEKGRRGQVSRLIVLYTFCGDSGELVGHIRYLLSNLFSVVCLAYLCFITMKEGRSHVMGVNMKSTTCLDCFLSLSIEIYTHETI